MPRDGTVPRIVTAWTAVFVWVTTFVVHLWSKDVYNDHFGRITPGRQIARYGELPFRDFLDPGYFGSEFGSAFVQRVFGDNLLGEYLLSGAFIASGVAVVYVAAQRLSRSYLLGLIAAALSALALPRPYDYDKVLFYPLGVVLAWRYIEHRRWRDLIAVAVCIVAAAVFRYDSAAYVGIAASVALVAAHLHDWRLLARRVAGLALLVAVLAMPFLMFVHVTAGLGNAIDQVTTYGVREARPLQLVVIDPAPPPDPEASFGERLRRSLPVFRMHMPLNLYRGRAGAFLYFFVFLLPVAAAAVLLAVRLEPPDRARVWSLIVTAMALNVFILRPPMAARIGGMAGPAAILGAWLAASVWRVRPDITRSWRSPVHLARRGAVVVAVALMVWSLATAMDWVGHFRSDQPFARLRGSLASLVETPADPVNFSTRYLAGLTTYLRECTAPDDRLFATWFVPELYFFAQRPFGGRMAFLWQWKDTRFQQRSIEALRSQSTVVVIEIDSYNAFVEQYPLIDRALRQDYEVVGESDFGGVPSPDSGYRVLVQKGRKPVRVYPRDAVPCFA